MSKKISPPDPVFLCCPVPAGVDNSDPLYQAGFAGTADCAPMCQIQFLCCKCHLCHGEITAVRVDIPGILQRIEIHTVSIFPQIIVFNMTGVKTWYRFDHLKGISVHIHTSHGKAVHIVNQCPFAQANETPGVWQRIHMNVQLAAGI